MVLVLIHDFHGIQVSNNKVVEAQRLHFYKIIRDPLIVQLKRKLVLLPCRTLIEPTGACGLPVAHVASQAPEISALPDKKTFRLNHRSR